MSIAPMDGNSPQSAFIPGRILHLHYDFRSHRAMLSVGGRDYVLPDSYQTREIAQVAAQEFAWEKLGFHENAAKADRCIDLPICLH